MNSFARRQFETNPCMYRVRESTQYTWHGIATVLMTNGAVPYQCFPWENAMPNLWTTKCLQIKWQKVVYETTNTSKWVSNDTLDTLHWKATFSKHINMSGQNSLLKCSQISLDSTWEEPNVSVGLSQPPCNTRRYHNTKVSEETIQKQSFIPAEIVQILLGSLFHSFSTAQVKNLKQTKEE